MPARTMTTTPVLDVPVLVPVEPTLPAAAEVAFLVDVDVVGLVGFEVVEAAAAGGAVVVVDGSSCVSRDSAVPAVQFTEPPPTACHFEPVTWISKLG
jgi:hypothetical protein